MAQFSANEAVSLEKRVDVCGSLVRTDASEISGVYEVDRCVKWIQENGFKKVCLQFPDFLLPDSSEVVLKLQEILNQTVYILGDTAYESCCIDYVAAAHINADAIIHYGPTCFSKTSRHIPCLYVYERNAFDVERFVDAVERFDSGPTNEYIYLVDTPYISNIANIEAALPKIASNLVRIDEDLSLDKNVVFIGDNVRKLMNISLSPQIENLYSYKPKSETLTIEKYEMDSRILKRRYFLREKIKDSTTVGLVVGTLSVKNHLKVIERMKKLLALAGKKYYLISVGKPTVAKLANFPEVDIYVMITCSMNEICESRDFYKPVVTPFDVEVALNANAGRLHFSYDYNSFVGDLDDAMSVAMEEDVSLVTGRVRTIAEPTPTNEGDTRVAIKSEGILMETNGAGYLNSRSWKGLEQKLGQTAARPAEEGRRGIAQGYAHEKEEEGAVRK